MYSVPANTVGHNKQVAYEKYHDFSAQMAPLRRSLLETLRKVGNLNETTQEVLLSSMDHFLDLLFMVRTKSTCKRLLLKGTFFIEKSVEEQYTYGVKVHEADSDIEIPRNVIENQEFIVRVN